MRGWTVNVDSVRVRSSKGKKFAFANDNGEVVRRHAEGNCQALRIVCRVGLKNCSWAGPFNFRLARSRRHAA